MQIDLTKLTDKEKIILINTIWESIEDKDNNIPVDDYHLKIILERSKISGKTIPWDDSKEKLLNLFK